MSIVTPLDILEFWIGPARDEPAEALQRQALWFRKSIETDREIADRFLPTLSVLAGGLDEEWARRGPRARLAAIIALDQFTRNIFRGTAHAFENDARALRLAEASVASGEDRTLTEMERVFLYLPFEHAENLECQDQGVRLFERLLDDSRNGFHDIVANTLDYAIAHRKVIAEFGRFPHRNEQLGRASTAEELAYLAKPGAGF